ncbi:DNA-binding transcriptional regulator, Lrp family [Goodfellowiella coeruleoviolacea]|uniref:DNA-binding transcriptional regulator, Lrp family n=1 Tax=Goodfellowiella coeruleoviolacea TaxID=334858 RepID=A0AAE3KJJ2_9PSEU|nr:DNA-binding transcriptional regulator, Lrp family [Goodfellowiella coeruleoviolacea]
MAPAVLDGLDRGLVHALQVDGRAPFSRIAAVLGVSEQTVARRYRRLRSAGVLRVVGAVNAARLGHASWTVRLRCTPDAAEPIAAALARRPDTFWVHVLSGGTEISCNVLARTAADRDALLLAKLPRTSRILGMTAHSILHGFALPDDWSGLAWLTDAQVAQLRRGRPAAPDHRGERADPGERVVLERGDHALLAALARDGRAGHAELAAGTGWSESTVRRRVDHLRRAGVLTYQLDIPPAALGFHAEARLWMSVRPAGLVGVANTLAGHAEVSFVAVTTGPTNLVATVVCRDSHGLYRYLTERVAALEAVRDVETAPVIRTVKRAGAVLPLPGPGTTSATGQ